MEYLLRPSTCNLTIISILSLLTLGIVIYQTGWCFWQKTNPSFARGDVESLNVPSLDRKFFDVKSDKRRLFSSEADRYVKNTKGSVAHTPKDFLFFGIGVLTRNTSKTKRRNRQNTPERAIKTQNVALPFVKISLRERWPNSTTAFDTTAIRNKTTRLLVSSINRRNKNWPTVRMGDILDEQEKVSATSTKRPPEPLSLPVNCSLLRAEDQQEVERVRAKLASEKYQPPNDASFLEKASDCNTFTRNYLFGQVTEEEASFPLAYAIRMHQNVAMAESLLRAIYRPQNVYCIHVDRKSPLVILNAMNAIAGCFSNVFLASKQESFIYGSFSAVAADLTCMKDMLNTSVRWRYFLNLAGTEYPLKTNLETVRLLRSLNGTNDIEQAPFPDLFTHRINRTFVVRENQIVPTNIRKEPFNASLTLQKGCSYNSFSRKFVEWLFDNKLARDFLAWSKDVFSPDELVWATLNHLPEAPGGYQDIVSQVSKTFLSREVIWSWSAAYCSGQHFVHAVCILSVGDLGWLSHRWEIIANKFDMSLDHYVIECLEESIVHRTNNPQLAHLNNWDYVKTFPQFRGVYNVDRPT